MPKIIGTAVRVVEHDGLTIDEVAGNVSTNCDTLSVAIVKITQPTSEPWLTLAYDEWICVTRGHVDIHYDGGILTIHAGETCFIQAGERFRPVFPVKDTEYIPVCFPAFRPDRCVREEDGLSDVAAKLQQLHATTEATTETTTPVIKDNDDVLYHMCQKSLWDDAMSKKIAYYPPTFDADGRFTHATAVPQRLITTANHFYTATSGSWICLELSKRALLHVGIQTVLEQAMPVGDTSTGDDWDTWICPHIYGGLPGHLEGIVTNVFDMNRDADGSFISIVGLTDK